MPRDHYVTKVLTVSLASSVESLVHPLRVYRVPLEGKHRVNWYSAELIAEITLPIFFVKNGEKRIQINVSIYITSGER